MQCNPSFGRRAFLKLSGIAALGTCFQPLVAQGGRPEIGGAVTAAADPTHVLRIRRAQVELAPGRSITTTTFDGQLPGPLLRGVVGQALRIDIHNDTDTPQRINWHGQTLSAPDILSILPGSLQRVEFTPARAGLYFYHSDEVAASRLDSGLYSGLVGGLLVEGSEERAGGRQCVVVLKDCEPFIRRTVRGCEVGYKAVTVNGRVCDDGGAWGGGACSDGGDGVWSREETRVGVNIEPVLIHVLNASATEGYSVEVPGHEGAFEVVALDGSPLPRAVTVGKLYVGPGERVTVRTELTGGWRVGRPAPGQLWDYGRFGDGGVGVGGADGGHGGGSGRGAEPEGTIDMVLSRREAARSGFNRWCINGESFSASQPRVAFRVEYGLRYRLAMRNDSDEVIPIHLQRHRLEIVRIDGRSAAGILKDVICIAPRQQLDVDFLADSPGRALLYCTRQLHRDFGLMALVDYT